jgi:hypothetical protein
MIGTMVSWLEVAPPELSRSQPQLVTRPRDGRDDPSPTPLLGTDTMNVVRKIRVKYPCLLCVSGPSSGP